MADNPSAIRYDMEAAINKKHCEHCAEKRHLNEYEIRSGIFDTHICTEWLCIDCVDSIEDDGYVVNKI